jgi:hypothetical protein
VGSNDLSSMNCTPKPPHLVQQVQTVQASDRAENL